MKAQAEKAPLCCLSAAAENVDAPTLARLYEEERARSCTAEQAGAPMPAAAPQPAALPLLRSAPAPSPLASDAGLNALPCNPPSSRVSTPLSPGRPVCAAGSHPRAADHDARQLAGGRSRRGDRAGAAVAGAAAHMASTRTSAPARPLAQLVDVVTGDTYELTSARATVGRERSMADVVLRDPQREPSPCAAHLYRQRLVHRGPQLHQRHAREQPPHLPAAPCAAATSFTFGLTTYEFQGVDP